MDCGAAREGWQPALRPQSQNPHPSQTEECGTRKSSEFIVEGLASRHFPVGKISGIKLGHIKGGNVKRAGETPALRKSDGQDGGK
jgi:hypothetical protein